MASVVLQGSPRKERRSERRGKRQQVLLPEALLEELDAYLHMGPEISPGWCSACWSRRPCGGRLAAFRQDLPAQPAESLKELGVICHHVMLVRDGPG